MLTPIERVSDEEAKKEQVMWPGLLRCIGLGYAVFSGVLLHAVSDFRSPVLPVPICPLIYNSSACVESESDEYGYKETSCLGVRCAIKPWATGYARHACESLKCPGQAVGVGKGCPTPCIKTNRRSLSDLWFGKEEFRIEEAFADGFLSPTELGSSYNAFLGASHISHKFNYQEHGVFLGTISRFDFEECNLQAGLSVYAPYKVIKVKGMQFKEETMKDMYRTPVALPVGCAQNAAPACDYAARLDFIRPVIQYSSGGAPVTLYVEGGNPASAIDLGNANLADIETAYVQKRCDGDPPTAVAVPGLAIGAVRFGKVVSQVSGALPADGAASNDDVRHFGPNTVNYAGSLGLDADTQRTLFLVPRIDAGSGEVADLNLAAAIANYIVRAAAEQLGSEMLFQDCDINIRDDDCAVGIGDLTADAYLGRCFPNCCFYGILGATFPTAKEQNDPGRVYFFPTGNNGHYELKVGAEGAVTFECCNLSSTIWANFSYNHVFETKEKKAAPFKGARIRNIGPTIDAQVSWHYFIGRVTYSVLHSKGPGIGALMGYEVFSKSKDEVKLCTATAIDCFGREKELDACILAQCTNSLTHKFWSEISHAWDHCRVFVGASHVFSGKNAMFETTFQLGISTFF